MPETYSLRTQDRWLLVAAALLVWLPAVLIDHEAGIREAAHAQILRELSASGQWLIPTIGGLPQLDAPPLTQWFAHLAAAIFGVSNVLVAIRLAGLLPLVLATLWTASFAASCSGRRPGILSGFVLLSTLGVAENVWHGGTVIWLVAASSGFMKLLASLECRVHTLRHAACRVTQSGTFHVADSSRIFRVFVLLGLATLIAGPVAALVTVLVPAAGHVLWRRRFTMRLHNPWFTGWLITATLALTWPVATSILVADSKAVWFDTTRFSFAERQPVQQLWQLIQMGLPWIPLAILGQWSLRHDAFAGGYSRERLLACWSISVPVAVFLLTPDNMSFALAAAGAWSVSAAIGTEWLATRIFKELPMLETRHNRAIMRKFLGGCAAVLTLSTVWSDLGRDSQPIDHELLAEARAVAEQGQTLLVDMNLGEQAAAILLDLGDLAKPLQTHNQLNPTSNSVVISSATLQQQTPELKDAVRLVEGHVEGQLIMLRMQQQPTARSIQIAAEPASARSRY
ncbi:MAG: hypothetical protein HQ518_13545 [Rhodopirellula sp.]|nr:hypothetical protein [Rhodopirellula sp.]